MDCRSSPLRPCWPSPHRTTSRHDRGCWSSPGPSPTATTRSRRASRPSGSWEPKAASPWTPPRTPPPSRRENLGRYRAIVFLNTSGDVLDERQKAAFQGFIQGGGGLAAVHQGVTTLDKWPWYVALVGGVKFGGHPQVQTATCRCEIRDHPATKSLPESWSRTDEWYNYEPNPRERVARPDDGRRVVLQGREDGEGPPHLLVSRRREGASLVHGPGAHEGGLWRTGLPPAPARGHPVGRGPRRLGAGRGIEGLDRPRLRGDRARGYGLLTRSRRPRRPISTASGARASRASSTRTAATGSPTGRAARPAASIAGCPSAASRPSSSTAATATASTRRRTPSPAA